MVIDFFHMCGRCEADFFVYNDNVTCVDSDDQIRTEGTGVKDDANIG